MGRKLEEKAQWHLFGIGKVLNDMSLNLGVN